MLIPALLNWRATQEKLDNLTASIVKDIQAAAVFDACSAIANLSPFLSSLGHTPSGQPTALSQYM